MRIFKKRSRRASWFYRPEHPSRILTSVMIYSQAIWLNKSTHIILRNGEEFTADMDMPWSMILFIAVRLPYRAVALYFRTRDRIVSSIPYVIVKFFWEVCRDLDKKRDSR
jgi:hypothetical protein